MVVRLTCFVQAHDEDVTVFASNLILLIPAQNLSKDSLPYRGVRRISLEGVRNRRAEKLSAVLLYRFILFFTDNFNVSKIGSLVVSSAVPICNGAV